MYLIVYYFIRVYEAKMYNYIGVIILVVVIFYIISRY